jgi:hypothetical protein
VDELTRAAGVVLPPLLGDVMTTEQAAELIKLCGTIAITLIVIQVAIIHIAVMFTFRSFE